jgi:protein SCO1/2
MLALAAVSLAAGRAFADSGHAHPPSSEPRRTTASDVTVRLHDLELLDQDGRRVKFQSDVIRNRLVAIDVVYTTCPVVCPILSATFADVQASLGSRLGQDVLLVSISVDPVTDVPARLKEYGRKWGAKPGWVFLTGDKRNVDRVLQGLNAYAADFTNHPSMVLVGDAAAKTWTRFYGFPTPEMVRGKLDDLTGRRQARR